jgi:hypothetical protein
MSAQPVERKIWLCGSGFDVAPLRKQLEDPSVWNQHKDRLYGPHSKVSDIWVRYRDFADYDGTPAFFAEAHESVWYPVIAKLPSAWSLARKVQRHMGCKTLGGVLITKVPPGASVDWHVDGGWHAMHYRKFGLQVMGNQRQAFQFEGEEVRANPGELYEFRNQFSHRVINESDEDRITMIVCAR